ncbi:hypothetical protein NBO_38g0020 [Nosema bombycis CQ1]|uniref:Uncharacterized protein n=1 Tax=Nosema bombycis (strain CQ1 / CVCC 102059) TaxID=578461 RepID=R0M7Y6_NOSB1|nr:hypothetical protein NBO_38g0020 [Nosema bombycis CQ1]|eukprot:EOB14109.1 hypothetical protein NBO_38g0020 [Nosema bombycis CQ1]
MIKLSSYSSSLLSSIGAFYLGGYLLGSIYGLSKRSKANYGAYLGNKMVVGGLIGLGMVNLITKGIKVN